jgi:ribosome-binding factor A
MAVTAKTLYEDGLTQMIAEGIDIKQLPKVEFDEDGKISYSESEEDFLSRCEEERK